jgi:amino acid transporter
MATIDEEQRLSDPADAGDLHQFGYVQSLRRTMGPFASFAVAFSMVSITTAIFFLLPSLFGTSGAAGVWLWLPCAGGVFLIVLVYAHLAARIPITGFAYRCTASSAGKGRPTWPRRPTTRGRSRRAR